MQAAMNQEIISASSLTSVQASAPPSEVEKGAGYRGVRPASSPLHAPCGVAAFLWNRWQLCRGISGSFRVEQVAALPWNQWQDSPGIGGSFGVEYAATSRDVLRAGRTGTPGLRVCSMWLRQCSLTVRGA